MRVGLIGNYHAFAGWHHPRHWQRPVSRHRPRQDARCSCPTPERQRHSNFPAQDRSLHATLVGIRMRDIQITWLRAGGRHAMTRRRLHLAPACRRGVGRRTGAKVTHIGQDGVAIESDQVAARPVFWAAGVMASPAAAGLGQARDAAGRAIVNDVLSVLGCSGVDAIGVTSAAKGWRGAAVPGLAPVAEQQGHHVARAICAALAGRATADSLRYRHHGNLATIGRWLRLGDGRGAGVAAASPVGRTCLVVLGRRPCFAASGRAQSCRGGAEPAVGLPDIQARHTHHCGRGSFCPRRYDKLRSC